MRAVTGADGAVAPAGAIRTGSFRIGGNRPYVCAV